MTHEHLKSFIESAYEHAGDISPKTKGVVRDAVDETLDLLDKGEARVAEKVDGQWVVNQWLKKAILLSFRLNDPQKVDGGPAGGAWFGQGPDQIRPLEGQGLQGGRLPRGAGRHRAPLGLYRAGRGADAVLRQSRRTCR